VYILITILVTIDATLVKLHNKLQRVAILCSQTKVTYICSQTKVTYISHVPGVWDNPNSSTLEADMEVLLLGS